jgi:lysosomal alpha-mannosidase
MEFIWRPFFDHFGTKNQIFTHVLFNHYSAPPGFNFDTYSEDDPIVDNPNLSTYNLDTKVAQFRDYVLN